MVEVNKPQRYSELQLNLDWIVLKNREIQFRRAWADQNVAARVAPKIEALKKCWVANGVASAEPRSELRCGTEPAKNDGGAVGIIAKH